MRGEKWLKWAGYGTWLVIGLPTILEVVSGEFGGWRALVWAVAFGGFGLGFSVCWLSGSVSPRRWQEVFGAALLVQAVAGLTMVSLTGNATAGATLAIVAAEAAAVFPLAVAWTWVTLQSVLLGIVWAQFDDWIGALTVGGSFAGFQAFAIAAMSLAVNERTPVKSSRARTPTSRSWRKLVTATRRLR